MLQISLGYLTSCRYYDFWALLTQRMMSLYKLVNDNFPFIFNDSEINARPRLGLRHLQGVEFFFLSFVPPHPVSFYNNFTVFINIYGHI